MTADDDPHAHGGDATDLTPEEKVGLIPTSIVTRDDLNRAERANIAEGLRWARRGRFGVLNPDPLMTQHKRMYGDVWRWAGQTRRSERNIGRDTGGAARALGPAARQHRCAGRAGRTCSGRDRHRLPPPAGGHPRLSQRQRSPRAPRGRPAGRKTRAPPPFSWGRADLAGVGAARRAYIAALKAADGGELGPLLAFARS